MPWTLGTSFAVQPFGQKWRSSCHRRLSVSPSDATKVVVACPDGKSYILTNPGATWAAADVVDTLTELKDAGGTRIGWRPNGLNPIIVGRLGLPTNFFNDGAYQN